MLFRLILAIFLFQSCSFFISETDEEINNLPSLARSRDGFYHNCSLSNSAKLNLLSTKKEYVETFQEEVQLLKQKNVALSSQDIFVLYSLSQIPLLPHKTSPSADFIILSTNKKSFQYHLYQHRETSKYSMPVFAGLEDYIAREKLKRPLSSYLSILSQMKLPPPQVDLSLQNFLISNEKNILSNLDFKPIYSRGGTLAKEGERIKNYDIATMYQQYTAEKKIVKYNIVTGLQQKSSQFKATCNFDVDKYENGLPAQPKRVLDAHLYGVQTNEISMIGIFSLNPNPVAALTAQTPYFLNTLDPSIPSICVVKNKQALISLEGRDSGQYIYHFLSYGVETMDTPLQVSSLMSFSRHLMLNNPLRIAIETSRSTKSQIAEILKMDLPIYHSPKLGAIYSLYNDKDRTSIILDDRHPTHMYCFNQERKKE